MLYDAKARKAALHRFLKMCLTPCRWFLEGHDEKRLTAPGTNGEGTISCFFSSEWLKPNEASECKMKNIIAGLVVAMSLFVADARADCDFRSCSGPIRQLSLNSINTNIYVSSANPADVTICDAVGSPNSAIFRLPKSHSRYQEMFSTIQTAAVMGIPVTIYATTQEGTCEIGDIDILF